MNIEEKKQNMEFIENRENLEIEPGFYTKKI